MRKITRITAMVTVFLATVLAMTLTAGAVGGFVMMPNLPENQDENVQAFYDLWVTPGHSQEITVTIGNVADRDIFVEIDLNPASISPSGIMHFSNASHLVRLDDSLEHNFDDLVRFYDGTTSMRLEISYGEAASVPMNINIPQDGFDGQILGAIHVLLGMTDEEMADAGMIINRFAQVMPIRLRISDAPVEPNFVLGDVRADIIGYVSSFVAEVHHTAPRISRYGLTSFCVYPAGSDVPAMFHENMSVEYAPNGIFEFILRDTAMYGIPAGNYLARVRVEYDGRVWDFEESFTVTAAEARAIDPVEALGQQMPIGAGGGLSTPVMIAIGVGGLLLLAIIIFLIVRAKKNKGAGQIDMSRMPQFNNATDAPAAPPASPAEDKLKGVSQEELEKMLEQMRKQNQNNSDK